MRVCSCGGLVRQHGLTKNREAWICNACGRYEVLEMYGQNDSACDIESTEDRDELLDSKDQ